MPFDKLRVATIRGVQNSLHRYAEICQGVFNSCAGGFGDGRIEYMRIYELALVFRPAVTETQRKKLLETIKGWLGEVKIGKEDHWGLKALSYKIKKETSGFFTILALEAKEVIPADFEKKLLAVEDVIRHLLIRKK